MSFIHRSKFENDLTRLIPRQSDFAAVTLHEDEEGNSLTYDPIRSGAIAVTVFDTETTDLDPRTAEPSKLGAFIYDPFSRQIIDTYERTVQIPEDSTYSVPASLIVNRSPDQWFDGMRPDMAVMQYTAYLQSGPQRIADYWRGFCDHVRKNQPSDIPSPPSSPIDYRVTRRTKTKTEREEGRPNRKTNREKSPVYIPSVNDKGKVEYIWAISRSGKYFYYKEKEKGKESWYRVETRSHPVAHNNRADNHWMMSWIFKYMGDNPYITTTKAAGMLPIDTLSLSKDMVYAGSSIRNPLQPGDKNGNTSFSKEPLVDANTRIADSVRGINSGVTLPDKSFIDHPETHVSPLYDALVEFGLYRYAEQEEPELLMLKKLFSDRDVVLQFLSGLEGQQPPLISFLRSNRPFPENSIEVGLTAFVDKSYGDFRKAVLLRLESLHLDKSGSEYRLLLPDRRDFLSLSVDDLADLLKDEQDQKNSPFHLLAMNKSPNIYPLKYGLKRDNPPDLDDMELMRDLVGYHHDFLNRLKQAYNKTIRPVNELKTTADPLPEELIFTAVGDPQFPMRVMDNPEDDRLLRNLIKGRLDEKIAFYRKRNQFLRRFLGPETELMLLNAVDEEIERSLKDKESGKKRNKRRRSIGAMRFENRVKQFNRDYGKISKGKFFHGKQDEPYIYVAEHRYETTYDAIDALWKLRLRAIREGWFNDPDPDHYKLIDRESGFEIDWHHLKKFRLEDIRINFDVGKDGPVWDIKFDDLGYSTEFMARFFFISGRQKDLIKQDKGWEDWWKTRVTHRKSGSPFLDDETQRFATTSQQLKLIQAIREGTFDETAMRAISPDPETAQTYWNLFLKSYPGREAILDALEAHLKDDLKKYSWTPERLAMAGYDPETQLPAPYIQHSVSPSMTTDKKIQIVPDYSVRTLLEDPDLDYKAVVIPNVTPNKAKAMIRQFKQSATNGLVVRTDRLHQHYYLPIMQYGFIDDFGKVENVDHVRVLGQKILQQTYPRSAPDVRTAFILSVEHPHELAGTHPSPLNKMTFSTPNTAFFQSLLAPDMAGFVEKPRGMVIVDHDYTNHFKPITREGSILRLKDFDMDRGKETGWEVETTLRACESIPFTEFMRRVQSGDYGNRFAIKHGFAGQDDMVKKITDRFTRLQKRLDDRSNKVLVMSFDPPKPNTMAFVPLPYADIKAKVMRP